MHATSKIKILRMISSISILLLLTYALSTLVVTLKTHANSDREPITITSHAMVESRSLPSLAKDAKYIIIGSVSNVYQSRWNTLDGTLSPETTVANIPPDYIIFTDVEITVDEVLKGKPQQSIRVRMFGGTVEQDSLTVSGGVQLVPGEKYVLFLIDDDALTATVGPDHYLVAGAIQGSYTIRSDEAVSPIQTLKLGELLRIIKQNS